MSNRLEMSKINSIKRLRQQGWSFVKIAAELGVHRSTVAKYAGEGSAADADSLDSKSTQLHTGSADSKPTELHTGTNDPSRSICGPFRETILKSKDCHRSASIKIWSTSTSSPAATTQ